MRERLRLPGDPPPGTTKMDLKRAAHKEKAEAAESSSTTASAASAAADAAAAGVVGGVAAVAEGMAVVGAAAEGLLS